jgi:high-affinity iron transporter
MLSSLLITLREGLEAALLVGLLLALVTRARSEHGARWIWTGVAAAVVTATVAGAALFAMGAELEGTAEAAYEAGTMLLAAAVLGWMIVWMSRKAPMLNAEAGGKVAAAAGSAAALFWLSFAIVVREGLETALFLFAAVGSQGSAATVFGGLAGLAAAVGLGYAVYRGGSRLNLRTFFTVLNVLLLVFGAYLVWRGFEEVGEIAAGGEIGEVAGPVAAAVYAGVLLWLLFRRRTTGAAAAA